MLLAVTLIILIFIFKLNDNIGQTCIIYIQTIA